MTSMAGNDPARELAGYYPAWLDNLAGYVTLEGSMRDGFAQVAEAVRTVLVRIRSPRDKNFHSSVLSATTAGSRTTPGSAMSRSGT
jgi:hypothetical protein